MQDNKKYPPIHVLNVMRGFKEPRFRYPITPYRFELKSGERHRVREIRQMHREKVGRGYHYHFVLKTREDRYFHIAFDTAALVWRLIQEVDEQLFFHN